MGRMSHIGEPLRLLKCTKGNEPATICEGRVQTGSEFVDRVAALSSGIRRLGLKAGERVAIAALNSDWYLEWLLGVPCAGGIIAPLNHRWSAEEACGAILEISATILVVDRQCVGWCSLLKKLCPSLKWLVYIGRDGPWDHNFLIGAESIIQLAGQDPDLELVNSPDLVALICFTSGTTGRPKGVSLSHNALIVQSEAKITIVGYSSKDVYLHTATLGHIGGISSALAIVMANGRHIILPKFEPEAVFDSIAQYNVSNMIVVPAMVTDMISYWQNSRRDARRQVKASFASLSTILNGAGGLSHYQLTFMKDIFPASKIMSAYGMTEACSSMTFLLIHDPQNGFPEESLKVQSILPSLQKESDGWQTFHMGGVCVGKPAPHVEIQVLAPDKHSLSSSGSISSNLTAMKMKEQRDNLSDLIDRMPSKSVNTVGDVTSTTSANRSNELHTVGRVLTRGAHVMNGYWGRPGQTKGALHSDGWLDTGDVGWMDEFGRLWLLGRQKDVIKTGGENVYASEVEDLLMKHPAVSAAAVVGISDDRLGEAVTALVRLRPNWAWEDGRRMKEKSLTTTRVVSESLLRAHCQQHGLSRYKVPKCILMQEEPFPVTSTGKVKKDTVRELVTHQIQALATRDGPFLRQQHSFPEDSIMIRSLL